MAWPNPNEYIEALQSPGRSFADAELQTARIATTRFGLPRPISGNFATVFEVETERGKAAVRCFMREVTNQQERYAAIADHLARRALPFMVNFAYLPEGIRVRGKWYPILKMDWASGVRLDTYIEQHLDDPQRLRLIGEQWVRLCQNLRAAQIAHGDLQHGNVLVTEQDTITLIDYDDMIVPGALDLASHEMGHRHYQHPSRGDGVALDHANFAQVDNFSSTVIGVSLLALALDASLWAQTKAGDENLLFRDADYRKPDESAALHLLTDHADAGVRALGQTMLAAIHARSYLDVPAMSASSTETRGRAVKTWLAKRLFDVDPDAQTSELSPVTVSAEPARVSADSWLHDYLPRETETAPPELAVERSFSDAFLGHERQVIAQGFEESLMASLPPLIYPYLLVQLVRRFPTYQIVVERTQREALYRSLEDQLVAAKARRKVLSRQIVETDRDQQQQIRLLETELARVESDLAYADKRSTREIAQIERALSESTVDEVDSADVGALKARYGESRRDLERQRDAVQVKLARARADVDSLAKNERLRQLLQSNEQEIAGLKQECALMRDELKRYGGISRRHLLTAMVRHLLIEEIAAP